MTKEPERSKKAGTVLAVTVEVSEPSASKIEVIDDGVERSNPESMKQR